MEIKEFITESLKQIVDGVVAAQKHAEENDALISGEDLFVSNGGLNSVATNSLTEESVQFIEFDLAVTTTENTETEAGAKIEVKGLFKIGADVQAGNESKSISRLKFSIPLLLPNKKRDPTKGKFFCT